MGVFMKRATTVQIGKNLRLLRQKAGLSQQELAAHLGISYQQLQKYETGANRISLDKVLTLRATLDVEYADFFIGVDPVETGQKAANKPSLMEDPVARAIYWKVSAVKDQTLRQKIRKVVNVLAS